jgi:structural maintenance of chromosome 1
LNILSEFWEFFDFFCFNCVFCRNTENQIKEQKELEAKMGVDIDKAKDLCKNLDSELGKIITEIGDAKVDKFESSRNIKKAEVIEQLKKKFPGVVSYY